MRNQPMRKLLPDVEKKKIVELAQKELRTEEGKEAYLYLKEKRKITDKVIEEFRIGYVPHWVTNLYDDKHEFAGRIIFPIYNQYDELVALSSRDWRQDAGMKFFHETYRKRNYLYGLNVAKENVLQNKKSIVVEGEFDVLALHSSGINCTVGMLGSSFHLEQISLLSRYCQEIYMPFDGDAAGAESMKKASLLCSQRNLRNMFDLSLIPVILPEKIDPDEFVNNQGAKKFIELLIKSKNEFL
jgi:DNA primase